jgi:hypothetical protein
MLVSSAMLWDLSEGKHLYSLDAGSVIHTLVFSPNRYWLCAGTDKSIVIWGKSRERASKFFHSFSHSFSLDLESKTVVAELNSSAPDFHVHQLQVFLMVGFKSCD